MAKLIDTQTLFCSNCQILKVIHLKVYHGMVCEILPNSAIGSLMRVFIWKVENNFLFLYIVSSIASSYYSNLCRVSLFLSYLFTGTIVYGV